MSKGGKGRAKEPPPLNAFHLLPGEDDSLQIFAIKMSDEVILRQLCVANIFCRLLLSWRLALNENQEFVRSSQCVHCLVH